MGKPEHDPVRCLVAVETPDLFIAVHLGEQKGNVALVGVLEQDFVGAAVIQPGHRIVQRLIRELLRRFDEIAPAAAGLPSGSGGSFSEPEK